VRLWSKISSITLTVFTIGIISILIYNNYIGIGFLEDDRTQNVLLIFVIVVDGSVPFLSII
jgi:hypothetical protein